MSSSTFLLLIQSQCTIGINVLEPLLKTQGLAVTSGTDISGTENTLVIY